MKPKKPSPLMLTLIAVAVLLVLFVIFAQVYTEVLWFDQLGVLSVYATEWITKVCLLYTSPSPRDLSTSRMPSSA